MKKKFAVHFLLLIEENNNLLSSLEEAHEEDVKDLLQEIMYDVDDLEIQDVKVKEK
jgi:hypothetical protein